MFLPNVEELVTMARRGRVPETVFGPDRARMAVRLFDARDVLTHRANALDWGSEEYTRTVTARNGLTVALGDYAEYADRHVASARS